MKSQDISEALGQVDDKYIEEAVASMDSKPRTRVHRMRNVYLSIAACMLLALIAIPTAIKAGVTDPAMQNNEMQPADIQGIVSGMPAPGLASTEGDIMAGSSPDSGFEPVIAATKASYQEVFDLLSATRSSGEKDVAEMKERGSSIDALNASDDEEIVSISEVEGDNDPLAAASNGESSESPATSTLDKLSADHSETNTQVEGIDEGDVVETDGHYIYRLTDSEVVILSAAGADSSEVARIPLREEESRKGKRSSKNGSGENGSDEGAASKGALDENSSSDGSVSYWPKEIYLTGDKLVAVRQADRYSNEPIASQELQRGDDAEANTSDSVIASDSTIPVSSAEVVIADKDLLYRSLDSTRTFIDVFDVSNPANPSKLFQVSQDGSFNSSRLIEGRLLLITNSYLANMEKTEKDKAETYVPCVYEADGAKTPIASDDVCILPGTNPYSYTSYATVSCLDLASRKFASSMTMLGSVSACYMSGDALYVAQEEWTTQESKPRKKGARKVTDFVSGCTTSIARIAYADGMLVLGPTAKMAGSILNQYSMDQYEGCLRVAICDSRDSWSEVEDKSGFVDYKEGEGSMTNSLYVFDQNMVTQGSIKDLAPGEEIKSVRFSGGIGYVVTFKQIDPLFAIDLADPAKPSVLSALKIPGFSTYLHPFGEGRLFGFGESVKGNAADGLKLSMFDTSNPADVTEAATLKVDGVWSEALYDFKAVFVDADKGIVGVPVDDGYQLFTYREGEGFAPFKLSDKGRALESDELGYNSSPRGLFCGDDLYVCSSCTLVCYSLKDGRLLNTVHFNETTDQYFVIE